MLALISASTNEEPYQFPSGGVTELCQWVGSCYTLGNNDIYLVKVQTQRNSDSVGPVLSEPQIPSLRGILCH